MPVDSYRARCFTPHRQPTTKDDMTQGHNLLERLQQEQDERDARLSSPTALRDAALWYAAHGWPVFPLLPRGKTPMTRNGFKDATIDPVEVAGYWEKTPNANIGTPTGLRFDVVDIDGPAGFASLAAVQHADCQPNCCVLTLCKARADRFLDREILAKAYTGGGGRHLLVAPTGEGNRANVLPGIDYRGKGGYIVVPPSVHAAGRRYDWINAPDDRLLTA